MKKFREDLIEWIRFYSRTYRCLLGPNSSSEDALKFAIGLLEHIEKGRAQIIEKPGNRGPTTPNF